MKQIAYAGIHTYNEATIGVPCEEWTGGKISDVTVITAGFLKVTRLWARQLDGGYEENFEKARVKSIGLGAIRENQSEQE